ncbi:hypothetical protein [Raineyella sp. LH-20]|uniref:hypothetical protein n=1 Tax=Raineyella sp. LH-20 TaxID=3081204 RepID=UPI002952DF65|nr:hypothetical protein [Raineyella sp. LH-20]WOP19531.1 hypothetical protein R0146_04445 [Raineyella sp. LH-20]
MNLVSLAIKGVPKLAKAGPKVLVPLGAGAAVAVAAATKGAVDLHKGKDTRRGAITRLAEALSDLNAIEVETERIAQEYGEFQIGVHTANLSRFADWLERNQAQVKRLNFKKVDGVRIRVPSVPKFVAGVQAITTGAAGLVGAVGAGAAAPAAALWGVSTLGTAGTDAAITGLSGAAATNATLAALGGGTLAAGGGGMAAGAAILGLTAAVPALLIGGFTVGVVGAKAKTESRKFAAEVSLEIERVGLAKDLLRAVQRRIGELRDLLDRMAQCSSAALDTLESVEFDAERHASEFLRALQLVTAVKEILNTPVLDPKSGELSEASIEITRKYA